MSRPAARRGLNITGPVEAFRQVVPGVTPAELTGPYSTIVLAVKARPPTPRMAALAPHLADDGFVLSAQNGLNELAIARRRRQRAHHGLLRQLRRRLARARARSCSATARRWWWARSTAASRERTRRMHALLSVFEPNAVLTDNIWGYLWGKLAYGAMLFATALTHDSMSDNFADPRRFVVFDRLAREVDGGGVGAQASRRSASTASTRPVFAPGAAGAGAQVAIDRRAGRVQPPHRQDPFRHLPRPGGAQTQDRGRPADRRHRRTRRARPASPRRRSAAWSN